MKTIEITVKGIVHGVGFRYFVQRQANVLGIHGYVKNLSSGDVFIKAQGTPEQLKSLVEICHIGPSSSFVKQVIVEELSEQVDFNDFQIIG